MTHYLNLRNKWMLFSHLREIFVMLLIKWWRTTNNPVRLRDVYSVRIKDKYMLVITEWGGTKDQLMSNTTDKLLKYNESVKKYEWRSRTCVIVWSAVFGSSRVLNWKRKKIESLILHYSQVLDGDPSHNLDKIFILI